LAVFDGHGMNGHLVSDFCKRTVPITLSNIINGGNGVDPIPVLTSNQGKKRKNKGSRHFLPPLVSQNTKKESVGPHSFVANTYNGIYDDVVANKSTNE
jgi:serine/threonine protein phosphatase PrpC